MSVQALVSSPTRPEDDEAGPVSTTTDGPSDLERAWSATCRPTAPCAAGSHLAPGWIGSAFIAPAGPRHAVIIGAIPAYGRTGSTGLDQCHAGGFGWPPLADARGVLLADSREGWTNP